MATNPILSEIQGLSPEAKGALGMAGHTLPSVTAGNAPPTIQPGMLLPHPDGAPAPNMSMNMPSPALSLPPTGPSVKAPLGTVSGDTSERGRLLSTGPGVDQIYSKITDSGFGQNHPFLGKLLGGAAEAGGKIGDTLLNAAPGIAREIPGTTAHHNELLGEANRNLGQDVTNAQKEALTGEEKAATGKTEEETEEMPAAEQSKEGLEGAQASLVPSEIAEHNAQAAALLHPQAKTDFEAWQQQNPGKPIEDWLKAIAATKNTRPDTPEQQFLDEYQQTHKGSTIADAEKAFNLLPKYQQPPQVLMLTPNGQGGSTAQTVRPGSTVAPGAQTAAGLNAENTPTTQQRTAAGRAETVVAMAPEVLSRIDALAPKLGPIEGRWNDFMQGRVGQDDPDFAALRSDLLMMSSAVALAHAQGRLPENLREEFDRAINSPKQTAANLKATINTMIPWLQQMQKQGQPNAQNTQPASTAKQNDPLGIR